MDKKEFELEKKLLDIEREYKKEILEYIRTTEKLKHQWELERGRIRTAEIRKSQMRKHFQENPVK